MDPFRLDGEIALITGAARGWDWPWRGAWPERGPASSSSAGARSCCATRRPRFGPPAGYVAHDVNDVAATAALVGRIAEVAGGETTILINNAGIHLKKWAVDTTEEEFQAVLNTHVLGAFSLTRAVAPLMVEHRHGSIVFIASMASVFGIPQVVAYSAAKSAYGGMVRALATELSPSGVRVNAIAPGWIDSDMLRGAFSGDPARAERILQRTPLHRLGEPEDIGHAAVYLCSRAAKFVTGTMLAVDGGVSIGF